MREFTQNVCKFYLHTICLWKATRLGYFVASSGNRGGTTVEVKTRGPGLGEKHGQNGRQKEHKGWKVRRWSLEDRGVGQEKFSNFSSIVVNTFIWFVSYLYFSGNLLVCLPGEIKYLFLWFRDSLQLLNWVLPLTVLSTNAIRIVSDPIPDLHLFVPLESLNVFDRLRSDLTPSDVSKT